MRGPEERETDLGKYTPHEVFVNIWGNQTENFSGFSPRHTTNRTSDVRFVVWEHRPHLRIYIYIYILLY